MKPIDEYIDIPAALEAADGADRIAKSQLKHIEKLRTLDKKVVTVEKEAFIGFIESVAKTNSSMADFLTRMVYFAQDVKAELEKN